MNSLLDCFPEKMLISSMLFLCMTAGNLFSANPETSETPQKHDASTTNKGLKNFLISAQEKEEWTRLMLAIQKSAEAVENLLDDGISPNFRGRESFQGYTPLIFASEIGSLETVKLLIERGARINDSDSEGRTALFHASENGHSKIISLLVKNGANPNAVSVHNRTPLMQATVNQHLEGMEILLKNGANVDHQNHFGLTALMLGAQNGDLDSVKKLLLHGAEINTASKNGFTALFMAVQNGHGKLVSLFARFGGEVNQKEKETLRTPLIVAAMEGHTEVVELLLSLKADPSEYHGSGMIPLQGALRSKQFETAELLIKGGSPVNHQDHRGQNVLHDATAAGNLGLVKMILEKNADSSSKNQRGETALMLAA